MLTKHSLPSRAVALTDKVQLTTGYSFSSLQIDEQQGVAVMVESEKRLLTFEEITYLKTHDDISNHFSFSA